ncbi:MAG: PglZ domain-containing protein [Lentisphaeria bacterium]|nr:PglZ domain-containing protein [Lentisphaeria bacterium]
MTIKRFIQEEVLLPRIKKAGVLVVYDPDRRYRELCNELADEKRVVVDATESSIESREQAMVALQAFGQPGTKLESMLVYVPACRPLTDEEKQQDPFATYGAIGAVFPDGDGDEYQSLCLKAKADHGTEIRRIFADNPNPPFDVIDAVGGGAGWPNLQALLKVESARDILFALLAPTQRQLENLKSTDAWVTEARMLFESTLGLRLKTKGKNWSPVADELWRFLLFSEFVFDLPGGLPDALADVPRAALEARPLVEDLCERLRDSAVNQPLYIERAESVETELGVCEACAAYLDLGVRDTFPFEERSFFAQAVDALKRDNTDRLRQLLGHHTKSVWIGRGENQAQWQLIQAAANLVQACEDADRQLPEHARSQTALIDFYTTSLREIDRLQREFEQAERDLLIKQDGVDEVVPHARAAYRKLVDKVQGLFVRHLEQSGWPPAGRLANADVFDKLIAPKLQESGRRVAVLLIDALRYELGVELQKQLADDAQVEVQAAFAQLPSITPVGMASLLPGAGAELKLIRKGDQMVVALGDQALPQVTQRMDVLRKRYGDRFTEMALSDFVRGKPTIPAATELLVLRSTTIDQHMESTPEMALRLIHESLKSIRVAIHKLRGLGFKDAFVVTDHGFYLNTATEAGDVCVKPQGNWLNMHERMLLGDGSADAASVVLPASQLGIRGDFAQIACPRAMVPYRAGEWYFHGGASLQEAVVPVIALRLQAATQRMAQVPAITLSYKRGAKKVTTRLPVVELNVESGDLFNRELSFEVLLEAHDKKGNVVGEAKPGGMVNPATRTLTVKPGETVSVALRMDMEFEGKFTIKALDPTTLTTHSKLDLETDYTV